MSSAPPKHYRAFLSYSHADDHFAAWLHRALEGYAVPRAIAGSAGRHGVVPQRLFPIFRDRDELASSADLPARIEERLADAEALIVVCSPAAAASRWVGQEIERFVALHGRDRVFCVIVAGEPHAGDGRECFPAAVRQATAADGTLIALEPIAADARPQGDGRDGALLKLLAGLLGVDFDRLRQRDQQRRRARNRLWAAAALSVIALLAAAAWYANLRRIDAEAASERAERAAVAERSARGAEREARLLAERREGEAREARDAAAVQRGRAESERAAAETQRRLAEQQRDLAQRRQQIALARQIAAQSERIRAEQPGEIELAALLAVEAARRLDSLETQQALLGVRRVLAPLPQRLGAGFSMSKLRFTADSAFVVGHDGRQFVVQRAAAETPVWTAADSGDTEWTLTPDGCCLLSWRPRSDWRLRRLTDGTDVEQRPPWLDALRGKGVSYRDALGFNAQGDLFTAGGHVLRVPDGAAAAPALRWAEFSADGRWFAQAGGGKLLVRSHEGALAAEFGVQHDPRPVLAADGSLVLAWGHQRVEMFDVRAGRSLFDRACAVPFFSAAFSPVAPHLALACSTDVLLIDARSGAVTATLRHDRPIASLHFHPSGQWLLTGSYDRTARVWETASGREVWRAAHEGYVADARFAPDGRSVLASSVGSMRRWPLDLAPDVLAELPRPIASLAVSRDGRKVAATTFEPVAELFLVDAATGQWRSLERTTQRAEALNFSADGRRLLVADRASLRVYAVDGGQPGSPWTWRPATAQGSSILAAAFGPAGELLVVSARSSFGTSSELTRCAAPAAAAPIGDCVTREGPTRARGNLKASFAADGSEVVFAADDEPPMELQGMKTGAAGGPAQPRSAPLRVNAVAFNGTHSFVALNAGREIDRIAQGSRPALHIAHDGWVHHLALAPDGSHLAAALSDPTSQGKNRVVVWRTADGQEVARFARPDSDGPVRFGGDGRIFYSEGRRVRALPWRLADTAAQVCERLPRNLRCDEWRQWLGDEPYRATCAAGAAGAPACTSPR